MYISKINLNTPKYNVRFNQPKEKKEKTDMQYSVYSNKGLNVYFGGLAKGLDIFEQECISILRKVRTGRMRKFTEDDITEILTSLRKSQKPDQKVETLQSILVLTDENKELNNKTIMQVAKVVSGRPDAERFAVLEYAENDLKNLYEPFTAFAKLPKENQDKLIKILSKISSVNDASLYKTEEARANTLDDLYNHFRILVFAHDDLNHKSKIEALKLLREDRKFFNNTDSYSDNNVKQKVISITDDIFNYFMEDII